MSINQTDIKYIYSRGEEIYDIYKKKNGIVKYLRDDSHEKSIRQYNPTHYYYYIEYCDCSFDTYVSITNFIPLENKYFNETICDFDYKNFKQGQRFCTNSNKLGTVRNLRDDSHENFMRQSDPTHYYYNVDFDDGTFETYIHGKNLTPL